jgi:coenzyme F420-0:L-glutamate ligase/coenzyme F420-1:gamma-L-glutamate ligase
VGNGVGPISIIPVPGLPRVAVGDDLAALISDALDRASLELTDQDILVVTQKIVSKTEGRYVDLCEVTPSARATEIAEATGKDPRHVEVILSESTEIVRQGPHVLVVAHRLGYVMANAGIDESNIEHEPDRAGVLLLPHDPDGAALSLKEQLEARHGVVLGVVISDSFGRPWRNGVTGVALGAAGVPSLIDLVGRPDLFGRALRVTEVAVADQIASAACLVMGEADEGIPVVLVRGYGSAAPHRPAAALLRPRERDLFR